MNGCPPSKNAVYDILAIFGFLHEKNTLKYVFSDGKMIFEKYF